MQSPSPRRTWKRRLLRSLFVVVVLIFGGLGAAPWLLATAPARSAVLRVVNRVLAPSRVGIDEISASWFGSVRLRHLTLVNAQGKTLVDSPRVQVNHGLLALAWNPKRLGTIVLDGATVDLERRGDGSIDLVDALMPPGPKSEKSEPAPRPETSAAKSGPGPEVTLRIVRGTLKLTTPELVEPVVAGAFDMEATLPSGATTPLSWKIRLANPPGGAAGDTLGIDGTFDHHAATDPDITLAIQGERWPVALDAATALGTDLTLRGRLEGAVRLQRTRGLWTTTGDSRLIAIDATGPALAGDRLRLDRVVAAWDVGQTAHGWSIQQAKVQSPIGELLGQGEVGGAGHPPSARVEATIDLAALSQQLPHLLRLRDGLTLERGSARLKAEWKEEAGGQKVGVEAWLSDLVARDRSRTITLRDPATLNARGSRTPTGLRVETLALKARWADIQGSGDLDKGLTLNGTFDLAALQTQFRDLIDFGRVELGGTGRMAADFRRSKPTAAAPAAGYVVRYAAEVKGLRLVGVTAGPVERETLRFDVAASGPADASGLPQGWEQVRVNLKSARDVVVVAAAPKGNATALSAAVSLPLAWLPSKVVERDGQIEAKFVGTWSKEPATVAIDELRLGLRPLDPALGAAGAIGLALKGRFELDADNLVLTPLPVTPGIVEPIGLAPEGLSLHGLRWGALKDWAGKVLVKGDVAALDRANAVWNATETMGLAGALSGQVTLTPSARGTLGYSAIVQVPDLSRPAASGKGRRPEGPFVLAARGDYQPRDDRAVIEELGLATRYGGLTGAGRIDELSGRLVADLRGTLSPAWVNISVYLRETVEPGLQLTGGARPFRLKGPLVAPSLVARLKGLEAEVGLDLASADAFGLKLGPTPLVVHCAGGAVTMDRIETTLNGGRVVVVPGFDVEETRGIALTIGAGTAISDAAINDEVSRRLLRYVAPVLDEATHVNGRVSLKIDRGEIPLVGPPDRRVNLTGQLTFQDVVFAPGPFASEMLTFVGQPDSPGLKLHQPVALAIADGRVIQKGLEIPVRRDTKVALEGSVGFDQTLDLRASVPLTRTLLGAAGSGLSAAGLDSALSGQRVTVPISGTVKKPRIDRQALQVAVRELSRGMLGRGLQQKAAGLIDRVAPPAPGADETATGDAVKGLGDEVLKRLAPRIRGGGPPPRRP